MKKNLICNATLILCLAVFFSACTNYGKKANKGNIDVFYKSGITADEAQRTADFLYRLDQSNETRTEKKSIQLTKEKDTVNFRMVVDKERMKNIPEESFEILANLVAEGVFNGKPVNMVLTDNHFKAIKNYTYRKINMQDEIITADSTVQDN
jgi:hypothetical protein